MIASQKITLARFRELYVEEKPYYELLDGEPVQKAFATFAHSYLQMVLAVMLKESGFRPLIELTLAISETWEPVPDVVGDLGPPPDGPYPTRPVPVVIEILSPSDPFTRVVAKCRRYAEWGVRDILVFDPIGREAWSWDATAGNLVASAGTYPFRSLVVELDLAEVFRRFDHEVAP
jgi:Uma2 family endonuclease